MNEAVIDVLQRATSQDPNILKPAEQVLREWETQKGFYIVLYKNWEEKRTAARLHMPSTKISGEKKFDKKISGDNFPVKKYPQQNILTNTKNVFSNHSLEVNVRWMALLCLKNGVERYWRKNAPNGIAEDEKEYLRRSLVTNFNEPVNQLATHLSVVIGKIARFDYPHEWEALIPTLVNYLRTENPIVQHRTLLTLDHVVKALASKRLLADRKSFEQLTTNLFNFILNLWNTYTETFLILISNGARENEINDALAMALLLLRILRKFIVNGFNNISKCQDAMLFLKVIFTRIRACLESRKTLMCKEMPVDTLEKFIIHLTKVHYGAMENHSICYVEFIPDTLEFVVFYCFTEEGKPYTFEKFTIQCFNMMKAILIHRNYRKPFRGSSELITVKDHVPIRADLLKRNFFTPEILKEICSKLVTHYFLLTQEDLEMWNSDPENYAVEDSRESWKYNLRACTETVFVSIFPQSSEVMSSVLMDLMQKYHQPVDPNDCHAILMKDAIYLAVGLVALDLYDEVDFNRWFSTTLKHELEIKNNNYRIIKRRVCWLIGKWTRVNLSEKLKPELYKMMIKALSPEEDLVVRLEASNTLKEALDDYQFHIDEFMPFLETTFTLLFRLLQEVVECDTKMKVLCVLSFVIERVGYGIRPYVGPLSAYLPSLWAISENHNMMRCAIISTLVHYVKALHSESVIVEPMIVNMVNLSCDLEQDAHVYLMEDGLELWLALLENAPMPTAGIISLLYNMPALLDSGLDQVTFRPAIYILQAYVLLSPQEMLGEIGARIIENLKSVMSDLRSPEITTVLELFALILVVSPDRGALLMKPVLGKLIKTMYMGMENEVSMVMSLVLIIMSRVLWNSRDVFDQLLTDLTKEIGEDKTKESIMDRLLEVWLFNICVVTQSQGMKIIALALCSLLTIESLPIIYHHFRNIIGSAVEVLNDIVRADDYSDSLLFVNRAPNEDVQIEEEDGEYKTEHQIRLKQIDFEDPVHTVCLKSYLEKQLNTMRRSMCSNQFDQMIASLKPETDQQLREYVSI